MVRLSSGLSPQILMKTTLPFEMTRTSEQAGLFSSLQCHCWLQFCSRDTSPAVILPHQSAGKFDLTIGQEQTAYWAVLNSQGKT